MRSHSCIAHTLFLSSMLHHYSRIRDRLQLGAMIAGFTLLIPLLGRLCFLQGHNIVFGAKGNKSWEIPSPVMITRGIICSEYLYNPEQKKLKSQVANHIPSFWSVLFASSLMVIISCFSTGQVAEAGAESEPSAISYRT